MINARHLTCLRENKGGDVAESYFSEFYRKMVRNFEVDTLRLDPLVTLADSVKNLWVP